MAGYFKYDGNAKHQATKEDGMKFGQSIANFSTAHSVNQNLMQQLVAINNMQAIQINLLKHHIMVINQFHSMLPNQYQPQW